ncbi:MAG: hypothetical protein ACREEM_17590 [Blastocatellia bacterium]
MVYVEYISRRPGIELADFHRVVKQVQRHWESSHSDDQLILNAGRTWRLGPEPEYLGVWYSPQSGFDRLDEWETAFRNRGEVSDEQTMSRVARIVFAGCYEALREPIRARDGIYYVERFHPAGLPEAIRSFYEERTRGFSSFTLNLLIQRIGRLGPDPGGLAVWTLPSFAALAEIATQLDATHEPVELVGAGLYVDIGQEIL